MTTNLTAGELAAFQVGLLAGRGFTPAQILAFQDHVSAPPTVRPEPRYGDPAMYATDTDDYPTGLPGLPAPKTGGRPGHQPEATR